MNEPTTQLDSRFSSEDASAIAWEEGRTRLAEARLYWLATVRSDGRPHITPLIAVFLDDIVYFCTGPDEQKAKNLEQNPQCIVLTGSNTYDEGLDIVVEGRALRVTDDGALQRLAGEWEKKYGSEWHFDVRDGAFHHEAGHAYVFEVAPVKAVGFGKGTFSQTRWRFDRTSA